MSKIICDVCGTSYPDTAEQCPICGCSRDAAADMLREDTFLDTDLDSGRNTSQKRKEIFDFDEVNSAKGRSSRQTPTFNDEEEEYEEGGGGSNTLVVVLLTVLIAVLLMAAAFLFFRFFLPNMGGSDKTPSETVSQTAPVFTTESDSIPCTGMIVTSGTEALLNQAGGMFLIHVIPEPSDTTDTIYYTSADESIATVTEDGRIEAVSEGETQILITCGDQQTSVKVTVSYEEETVPPTTAETVAETVGSETQPEEAGQEDSQDTSSSGNSDGLKDVTLKLKKTDVMLGVYYEFQLLLDCDLEQDEVEWSSEHPHIATVDEYGNVKAIKAGTTSITAKYGDQEVSCIVRCN